MKKFLFFLPLFLCFSCGNLNKSKVDPQGEILAQQVDSLNIVVDSLKLELYRSNLAKDSLSMIIGIKNNECASHDKKLKHYEELVEEYKTVLYAIVGEDGLYNYIEYD